VAGRSTHVECTIKTRALRYVYSVFDPECFGGRLVTLVEYTECQVEIVRVIPVAGLVFMTSDPHGVYHRFSCWTFCVSNGARFRVIR